MKKIINEDALELIETPNEEKDKSIRAEIMSTMNCDPEEFAKKYNAYKRAEAKFREVYEPFKQKLLDLYKEAPDFPKTIIIGNIKATYVSPSVRTAIDSKKLKEEEPEIAKKFTKTTEVNATLRLEDI